MSRVLLFAFAIIISSAAHAAQPPASAARAPSARATCPNGTSYAIIRHSSVKPGKWALFERAVSDHAAWYASKGNRTVIRIVRMIDRRSATPGLSNVDAVTITKYVGDQPERDAAYSAFAAKYKDSATIRDEMRVCMPVI